jgi:16S rRNA (cytosine1402-N4)-methyltransferase
VSEESYAQPQFAPEHRPVLWREIVEFAAHLEGGPILDLTVGAGGHAAALLAKAGAAHPLFALDRDPEAVAIASLRLADHGARVQIRQGAFDRVREIFPELLPGSVALALFDLGVSSMQLDTAERGFSFDRDGPLDMRMDPTGGRTAESIVARASEAELAAIFRDHGGEPRAAAVARAIVAARQRMPIKTTGALSAIVSRVAARGRGIHPATRVFQALRIAVNDELSTLARGLDEVIALLCPGGKLAVISFHSLEDRIVKERLRDGVKRGELLLAARKPLQPSAQEMLENRRSRSAKLRLAVKI